MDEESTSCDIANQSEKVNQMHWSVMDVKTHKSYLSSYDLGSSLC